VRNASVDRVPNLQKSAYAAPAFALTIVDISAIALAVAMANRIGSRLHAKIG